MNIFRSKPAVFLGIVLALVFCVTLWLFRAKPRADRVFQGTAEQCTIKKRNIFTEEGDPEIIGITQLVSSEAVQFYGRFAQIVQGHIKELQPYTLVDKLFRYEIVITQTSGASSTFFFDLDKDCGEVEFFVEEEGQDDRFHGLIVVTQEGGESLKTLLEDALIRKLD